MLRAPKICLFHPDAETALTNTSMIDELVIGRVMFTSLWIVRDTVTGVDVATEGREHALRLALIMVERDQHLIALANEHAQLVTFVK
jgi:hypothetical protein